MSGTLSRFEAALTDDPQSVFAACAEARKRYPLVHGLSRCSDVHIASSFQCVMHRVDGDLVPMTGVELPSKAAIKQFIDDHVSSNEWLRNELVEFGAASISYWGETVGRLRVSILQTNEQTLQIRLLPEQPPPWGALHLPPETQRIFTNPRGAFIVCGRVSSGKSTALAAAIDAMITARPISVLSVDDTQEYRYDKRMGVVYSVELGQPGQARTYRAALKNSLRSDINALIVGEARTTEVLDMCLQTAEAGPRTGWTLHTRGALPVVDRILGAFAADAQPQVRQMLANSLQEVLYIALLKRKDGEGRVPAVEFFHWTEELPSVLLDVTNERANSVQSGLRNYVEEHQGERGGMLLFETHLYRLVEEDVISRETALEAALRPDELRKMLKITERTDRRQMVMKPAGIR